MSRIHTFIYFLNFPILLFSGCWIAGPSGVVLLTCLPDRAGKQRHSLGTITVKIIIIIKKKKMLAQQCYDVVLLAVGSSSHRRGSGGRGAGISWQ